MKKIIVLFIALFSYSIVSAQTVQKETNFAIAKKLAKEQEKEILLLFTGSDWCPACIHFDKNVLQTNEFKQLLEDKFILLYIDFPRRKPMTIEQERINYNLMRVYEAKAFPTLLIVDKNGEKKGEIDYFGQSAKEVIEIAEFIVKED